MDIISAIRCANLFKKKEALKTLTTIWGEKLLDHPEADVLPEYPRPQMIRDSYINLNGYWNYAFTNTARHPERFSGKIRVPFSPETLLSGVQRQLKPDEYLWYERTIVLEKCSPNKRLILHFGAVDQYAVVYLNGKRAGSHLGGYLPFEMDITDFVHEGQNFLSVCVKDLSDTSYHSRGKQKLKRGGMFYTAQSGIWQTVWMEWVPETYIVKTAVSCLFDECSFQMLVTLNQPLREGSLYCRLLDEEGKCLDTKPLICVHERAATIVPNYSCVFQIPNPRCWSPQHPYLYHFDVVCKEDLVRSYSAMRCFGIEKNTDGIPVFCLNHEPLFLNGVLDQGYWPDGLYTAPSDEALIYDIREMKNIGFNMLRKHIKIEPARWYYHCDRLGMIVWQDMVNGGPSYVDPFVTWMPALFESTKQCIDDTRHVFLKRQNKKGKREWMEECDATIETLKCFPCISTWVPFNEGWGQFHSAHVTDHIRAMDPERTIDSASGWFDQGAGDFYSIHNYYDEQYMTVSDRACGITEYGGYACQVPGHICVNGVYGYRIYDNMADFRKAFSKLLNSEILTLAENGLSAAVYTQLSDVEEEVNGILTYDRRVNKLKKKHQDS